ncbi:MAG: hypothetical protein HY287_07540 [Planctomycetes bacterium]|nr:hypothetical protein [Planctomycetota bacterium]MBI3834164.1 hypothetical protein [Planctomycetota bacterium]
MRTLIFSATLGVCTGCGFTSTRDLSDFKVFAFQRFSVFGGYCLSKGAVLSAEIIMDGDRFHLQLTVAGNEFLAQPDTQTLKCPEQAPIWIFGDLSDDDSGGCVARIEMPERDLSESEINQLKGIFGKLIFNNQRALPPCGFVITDPCMINNYQWDELHVDDFECERAPNLTVNSGAQIIEFLDSLRTH